MRGIALVMVSVAAAALAVVGYLTGAATMTLAATVAAALLAATGLFVANRADAAAVDEPLAPATS